MIDHWKALHAVVIKPGDGRFALELRHIRHANFIGEEVCLQIKGVRKEPARSAIEVLVVHTCLNQLLDKLL